MIPQANIIEWRTTAPWGSPDQVEHDLVLSRAICELYANPKLASSLVFRGGTALHKLYFERAGRFSDDLDFVQAKAEPIGEIITEIRNCLDEWLGKPSWKQGQNLFTLYYRFTTEIEPIIKRKVKIEINTREHISVKPYVEKAFNVTNDWFNKKVNVLTYSIEELLATKLRALYQRKKGRDLYDFWYATRNIKQIDIDQVISIFNRYMSEEAASISRAEFEKNLILKQSSPIFINDIKPLLSSEYLTQYQVEEAFKLLFNDFLPRLSGHAWKGSTA